MNIKTKYNIDDVVWFIIMTNAMPYNKMDKYELRRGRISSIGVEYRKYEKSVYYEIDTDYKMMHSVNEKLCFSTQAEAQAECDRRNK